MSIGADLPPAPIQCPMCRRWYEESELRVAVASCEGEVEQRIAVCRECHGSIVRRGEVVVMMNHRPWMVCLPEAARVPGR